MRLGPVNADVQDGLAVRVVLLDPCAAWLLFQFVRTLGDATVANPTLVAKNLPRRAAIAHNDELATDVGGSLAQVAVIVFVFDASVGKEQDEAIGTFAFGDELCGSPRSSARTEKDNVPNHFVCPFMIVA